MVRLLFISLLSALTFICHAELVTQVIHFDRNSAFLSAHERDVLRNLLPSLDEYFIENIDIDGFCGTRGDGEITHKRAKSIYGFLTTLFPDFGDYEIRISPAHSSYDTNSNCATIRLYYLKNHSFPGPKPNAHVLFPEEFERNSPELSSDANGKLDIGEILFHGNSAVFLESAIPNLNIIVEHLLLHSSKRILLVGHVNGHAGKAYLKKAATTNPEKKRYDNARHLSEARAESVKEYFEAQGIDGGRIEVAGKGGQQKRYKRTQSSDQDEANRRLEIFEM